MPACRIRFCCTAMEADTSLVQRKYTFPRSPTLRGRGIGNRTIRTITRSPVAKSTHLYHYQCSCKYHAAHLDCPFPSRASHLEMCSSGAKCRYRNNIHSQPAPPSEQYEIGPQNTCTRLDRQICPPPNRGTEYVSPLDFCGFNCSSYTHPVGMRC